MELEFLTFNIVQSFVSYFLALFVFVALFSYALDLSGKSFFKLSLASILISGFLSLSLGSSQYRVTLKERPHAGRTYDDPKVKDISPEVKSFETREKTNQEKYDKMGKN